MAGTPQKQQYNFLHGNNMQEVRGRGATSQNCFEQLQYENQLITNIFSLTFFHFA
jgi:hypothetical protein